MYIVSGCQDDYVSRCSRTGSVRLGVGAGGRDLPTAVLIVSVVNKERR